MKTATIILTGSGLFWMAVHCWMFGHDQVIRTALVFILLMLGLISWQIASLGRHASGPMNRHEADTDDGTTP